MCGVCGVVALGSDPAPVDAVPAMASSLHHRGPDRTATWVESTGRAALGHARLSIVDLSSAGDQPMASADGRWTIAYNGELYNTAELRRILPGSVRLRGHSDTEVLLELVASRGPLAAVQAARGMFAFVAWDGHRSEAWLARDRFGEKPLYYGVHDGALLVGSELKALRAVPGFRPGIDRRALAEYFRWTNVPAPLSILDGVAKLPPAHLLRVPTDGSDGVVASVADLRSEPYWSAVEAAATVGPQPTGVEAEDRLQEVLQQSVVEQMVSDVPLGAFLSGGIDSSTVVALMQRASSDPVRTFTIGFEDRSYDESGYAADVAAHLGTDHTDLVLSAEDAMAVIPTLANVYDEPFADSSQVPTILVSRLARESVAVALSGDGGDELFCGYTRYREVGRLDRLRRLVPGPVRRASAALLTRPSVRSWDRLGAALPVGLLPSGLRHRTGHRVHKAAGLLGAREPGDLYAASMSVEATMDGLVLGAGPPVSTAWNGEGVPGDLPAAERAMLVDTGAYLPDDLLAKVDRASMSVSLEVRVPFLSPEVFEVAWGLRPEDRIRGSEGKWILRQVLRRSLPDHLIDRPKMGFGVPVGDWLRGPLRDWADDLLSTAAVERQGLLDAGEVARRWEAHRSGAADLTFQVWALLMFQAWIREWQGP